MRARLGRSERDYRHAFERAVWRDAGPLSGARRRRATASSSSGAGPRPAHDPWRHQGLIVEDERTADGAVARVATVFLTGRECPWRCAMCDLWRYTTVADTPRGRDPGADRGRARGAARPAGRP